MNHVFPFSLVEKGSKIVLYGASDCGYDYYRQILSTGFCELICWVDRQWEWWRNMNLPVSSPEELDYLDYDYIVISVENAKAAKSICSFLDEIGVEEDKIIWESDCRVKGDIALKYDSDRIKREMDDAQTYNPRLFLRPDRLDLIVREQYAKDIINRQETPIIRDMYKRMMMVQNGGKEPTEGLVSAYFSEYALKRGWKAFDKAFRELIISMQENGFNREGFIPLDKYGRMINGAHRVSVALALGISVWVRHYPFDGVELIFDKKWFLKKGFSDKEISIIEDHYKKEVSSMEDLE